MRQTLLASLLVTLLLVTSSTPPTPPARWDFRPWREPALRSTSPSTTDSRRTRDSPCCRSQGYLWIGSQDGLNRLRWLQFTQFKARILTRLPEHSRFIGWIATGDSALTCSPKRRSQTLFWVGTWGGGLDRFDPKISALAHYTISPEDADASSIPPSHPSSKMDMAD